MTVLNAEKIVSDYLKTQSSVTAITSRVVGKTPAEAQGGLDTAWVKVVQLDALNTPNSRPEHLISYLLQFDCYSGKTGGQPEATALGRAVRNALVAMNGTYSGAVVTCVTIASHIRLPDTALKDAEGDARERVIISADVFIHA